MILGLTGYYCSGKSTVEKILAEKHAFKVIDMDKIGHEVLKEKTAIIVEAFGDSILENGMINRKALGSIVFSDKNKLTALNKIVHPAMVEKASQIIQKKTDTNICISAAILFDMGLDNLCDKIIVVKTSLYQTLKRAKKRDNYDLKKVFSILSKQKLRTFIKTSDKNISFIKNNKTQNKLTTSLNILLKTN